MSRMRLRDLSIRSKITLGFVVMLLLTATMGAVSVSRLGALNGVVQDTVNNDLVSLTSLSNARSALVTYRISLLRGLLFAGDPAAMQRMDSDLAAAHAALQHAEDAYRPTITTDEERGIFQAYEAARDTYFASREPVLASLRAGKAAEALAAYRASVMPVADAPDEKLKLDLDYNATDALGGVEASNRINRHGLAVIVGLLAVCVAATVLLALALIGAVARPIAAMTEAMRRLAAKDLAVAIPAQGRHDEIGRMADSVAVFRDAMVSAAQLSAAQQAGREAVEQRSATIADLTGGFERKVGQMTGMLAAAATELQATAAAMSATAQQTDTQAASVARSAGEASSGVQTVAAAAEQLTASVEEISRQVKQSADMTVRAAEDARRTDAIVQALSEGAQKIGDVVSLITTIAGQTNLLALNAAIEAARAGEAGKGFAVVASEVKGLAQQTAKATDEIAAQIGRIQDATHEAVGAIRGIGRAIDEVSAIATTIASAVEEQGAATAEIARNVQQTATGTRAVTETIAGVSRAANDTGGAAREVLASASGLSQQAEMLAAEVQAFVGGIRAA